MSIFKITLMAALLLSTPLLLSACEDKNALEEGAEEVSDEIDDATSN